jgi:L-ascorbate metabolism protein UlaG (beta-lactamase superfamily)
MRVKKIILYVLILLFITGATFIFVRLSPSGEIKNYSAYYIDENASPKGHQVKVSFFGVSTLLFDDGETQILIDGFFSRPSIRRVLFTRMESDTTRINHMIEKFGMDRVKGIFVTHSHFDHAFDVAYTTRKTGANLYGSESTLNIARGGAVDESRLKLFQPYETITLGRFTVQIIPSKHSPNNGLKDDGVVIEKPLYQPAKMKAYSEGGSFDFYIHHEGNSIYVKPSPNFIEGRLDTLRADVLFLGIATISNQDSLWKEKFYEQNVGKLKPKILIPLHWDNFFQPLSENLVMLPQFVKSSPADFDFMIRKTRADKIDFKILQGGKSILLF